ncbi:hypothetical protein AGLY_012382 [Aphis glycines]|uniref:Uncharacterized protein n=1 Tax=Aphis glycines TaxID=307491 RepID=A0A6G0T9W5_APHGL|nr:hypothetical protein AGLY_012382 [Aphis glycines]
MKCVTFVPGPVTIVPVGVVHRASASADDDGNDNNDDVGIAQKLTELLLIAEQNVFIHHLMIHHHNDDDVGTAQNQKPTELLLDVDDDELMSLVVPEQNVKSDDGKIIWLLYQKKQRWLLRAANDALMSLRGEECLSDITSYDDDDDDVGTAQQVTELLMVAEHNVQDEAPSSSHNEKDLYVAGPSRVVVPAEPVVDDDNTNINFWRKFQFLNYNHIKKSIRSKTGFA